MKLDKAEVVEARERLGLSIELLAKRAAVSKNSVSRAEHGLDIRPITARRIAHGLGLEVSDLYPKAEAPPSLPSDSPESGERRIIDMGPAEFHKRLSEARSKEALLGLYHRVDAERVATELAYRDDEDNAGALKDYERGMRFYLMAALSLSIRGETPPDPEKLATRARELEELRSNR